MGKGIEQESEGTPVSHQMQIIGSNSVKLPQATFATHNSHFKSDKQSLLVVSDRFKQSSSFRSHQLYNASSRCGSTFPDYSPPVALNNDLMAFSENDRSFFRSLSTNSYIDIKKAKFSFRQCPLGQQGGANGGGAYYGGSSGGNQSMGGSYGFGSGGSSDGMGGASGGSGDDDPSKRPSDHSNSGPHSLPFIDEEDFNSFNYLDPMIEDLLRDMPFEDIVVNPQFGFNRDPVHSYPTDPTDPSDNPSTPAPLTPLTPMYHPPTPSYNPQMVSSPPNTNSVQQVQDTMVDLFEINQLMISAQSKKKVPDMTNTATLVPRPHSAYPSRNSRVHSTASDFPVMPPMVPRPIGLPKSNSGQMGGIDFLTAQMIKNGMHHVIELFVPQNVAQDKYDIGFKAFNHSYEVYLQYLQTLKSASLNELQVANQQTANLCEMKLYNSVHPKLCFEMPESCIFLSEWSAGDHSIDKRQIVLQQVINTLTILFKAQNNLCFWGSFQIWIDSNYRVFLYVDFIKSLAIQKEYAEKGIQSNPRIEDCKVLLEVYNTILKPFLQRDFTWISPQLKNIFNTFEDVLKNPEGCVANMAFVARVLGERRICKLQANLVVGGAFQYTIYCAEHETISESLGALAGVLPGSIANCWAVFRSHGNTPVGVTDIAVKGPECSYNLFPLPPEMSTMPGALYIRSW